MRVREATEQDFGEIARLTVAAYRALDTWVGDDYALHLADVAGRAKAENAVVLVAEDDEGRLLGSVTLTLGGGPLFEWQYGVDGDCGFRMLAVDPAAQGRGAGAALVAACVARARAAGKTVLLLHTTAPMTAAHRLYERAGFRRDPERDEVLADGLLLLAYALDLHGGR
jgi:ribosomal protein S18 acetylase RimI-like enzyme